MDRADPLPIVSGMPDASVSDAADIERVYREHGGRIWHALLLFGGDPEVASDAVAEAFAQALRRGDRIRDVDRWVWRAASAIARGELQRRRSTAGQPPESPVEMPEPTVDLMRALAKLSTKQRGALILRLHAGYSAKEMARIMGSTAGAVGMHLERARRKVRDELEVPDDA
jgi:RNA polymerase sigma-70 factor (ECF subfamily)